MFWFNLYFYCYFIYFYQLVSQHLHLRTGFILFHFILVNFKIWLVNSRKYGTTGRWLLRLHHIPGSSSHEDCNCNFWKSQKPIEGCVRVRSFQAPVRAGGTHGLTQLYHGVWDNDCHTRVPFFFPQKKKKKKKLLLSSLKLGSQKENSSSTLWNSHPLLKIVIIFKIACKLLAWVL